MSTHTETLATQDTERRQTRYNTERLAIQETQDTEQRQTKKKYNQNHQYSGQNISTSSISKSRKLHLPINSNFTQLDISMTSVEVY
jgi:hypothetical protein